MASGSLDAVPVRVSIFAPARERCGISDYSRNLLSALQEISSVDMIRCVEPPPSEARLSFAGELSRRGSRAEQYRRIGDELSESPSQLIHIQHEYSLLGGVAPHRNQAAALYASVTLPMVVTVHEIVDEGGGSVRTAAIRRVNKVNFLNHGIRKWIVHTSADKERLAAIGAKPEAIHVVPVGVPNMPVSVGRENARARLGLSERRVVTLFGFLSAKKGHMKAIEAISQMPEDVVLLLAGDKHPDDHTDYVARLKNEIEVRDMSYRVRITGYLSMEELQCVLAATDVAVAPFHQSSGSASVAMLLAADLPLVASSIPVFADMNAQGAGPLVLAGIDCSPENLACELLRVLSSTELREDLRIARARYVAAHTYSKMAEATVNVYKAALQG